MSCRICGTERDVKFRLRSLMSLCATCHSTTPKKASRDYFDKKYWGKYAKDVPERTKREFFSDYKTSSCKSVAEYYEQTTSF